MSTLRVQVPTSWCAMQVGLNYICATAERFFAVSAVLNAMVAALPEQPSTRLLKHIIRCYLRLSDNTRAREALRQCLPALLRDPGFTVCLKDDLQTRQCAPCVSELPLLLSIYCHGRGHVMGEPLAALCCGPVLASD